jgi:hypothetical protein
MAGRNHSVDVRDHGGESNQVNCFQLFWKKHGGWILTVAISLGVLLFVILFPLSFHAVEYDEYALDRDKLRNNLDYNHVYENGNHFTGVNHEMIAFPRVFQFETFVGYDLPVFTSEGIQIGLQASYQWALIKTAIPSIHRQFRLVYKDQVHARVKAAIKNTATQFSADDFIKRRGDIDEAMTNASSAAIHDLGFNLPPDKFQLDKPLLPDNIVNKNLQTVIQLITNQAQAYKQQEAQVFQQTNVDVNNILSNGTRIVTEAQSQADRIISEANSFASNVVVGAEQAGLNNLFVSMGITNSTTKAILSKFIAIDNAAGIKLTMGLNPNPVYAVSS